MSEDRLHGVLATTLGLSASDISDDTSMQTCNSWDSLQHFHVIMAVEHAFGVRFPSNRIPDLTSVRALREQLESTKSK